MPDNANFPSAPSQPVISNISDTELDIEWRAPDKNGGSPITGYILQYFCPNLGQVSFLPLVSKPNSDLVQRP